MLSTASITARYKLDRKSNLRHPLTVAEVSFCAMLIISCFQTVILAEIFGLSVKAAHVFFIPFAIIIIAATGQEFRCLPWKINLLFAAITLSTFTASFYFGVNSVVANYLYMYFLLMCCYNYCLVLGINNSVRAIRFASFALLCAIAIKLVVYSNDIIAFLASPKGHPIIPFFFGGGANLEATWIAMFGVFYRGSKLALPYALGAAVVSAIYASRAGMIACVFVILYLCWSLFRGDNGLVFIMAISVVAIAGFTFLSAETVSASYLLNRFSSIGNESGSLGRLAMWQYVPEAFSKSPLLGYGAGNTLDVMRSISGYAFTEDNIHNYYLQVLLDFGLPSFVLFASIIIWFVAKHFNYVDCNPYVAFVLIYLILALVEFRGAEPFIAIALAGVCAFNADMRTQYRIPRTMMNLQEVRARGLVDC